MRRFVATFALAAAAVVTGVGSAEAQVVSRGVFGPRQFVGPGGPVTLTPGYGAVTYSSAYVAPGAVVKPYSYYVLPAGVPSREYVGPAAFPFYGRPYGHPYDRWTWTYMSTAGYGELARYYYPPLGW